MALKTSDRAAVQNAEIARMGATAYATKKKVTPDRWRRIVKDAHTKGFTVDSFLQSDLPDPMKARTNEGMTRQAQSTIASAYAPAEAELTQAEKRAQSIGDKRSRDNKYYLDWLTARSGELNAHAQAADQKLIERNTQIADETAAHNEALKSNLVAQAQATQGNSSDPNQSTAIAGTAAEGVRSNNVVANQRQASSDFVASREKQNATDQAANFAQIAASQARAQADTYKSLQGVADERTKLALAKGADSSKEIARLLDQEIDKANSNREFGAALQKLNIQGDANKIRLTGIQTTSADRGKSRALTAAIADRTASQRDQEINLKGDRLTLDWYKAKHPNKGKGKNGKETDPQSQFDRAVARIQATTFEKPSKDGKSVEIVKSRRKYVENRRDQIIAQVMQKEKVSREIASRAVEAYLKNEDDSGSVAKDPGSFKLYGPKAPTLGHKNP